MLRYASPRLLFQAITWDEFITWRALYELQPWGQAREDRRLSVMYWQITRMLAADSSGFPEPVPEWPYYRDRDKELAEMIETNNAFIEDVNAYLASI